MAPPDDTTQQLLRDVLQGQQELVRQVGQIAVSQARLEQALTGHQDLQRQRTEGRDRRCALSESRTGELEAAVQALQLAQAGSQGGQSSRATVAAWCAQGVTAAIAAWAALKGR